MRRREFIAAAAAVGLVPARTMFGRSRPKQTDRPNILYIMTDQQQAAMMSCMGEEWVKTPALDGLVASGTRFEKACASNPVCVPSRFSLQTGLMPNTIGMGRNEDSPQTVVTDTMIEHSLGRLFNQAGYETVYGGKVHLPKRMNRIEKLGYRYITSDRRQGLADTCAKFLKGRHDRPFFLFASFINPHDICYMAINAFNRFGGKPPIGNLDSRTCEAVLDRARKSGDLAAFVEAHCPALPPNHDVPQDEPECITLKYLDARPFRAYIRNNWTDDQWRLHRWTYRRLTERVDKQIGTVLDALREAGLEDNTLIVFTSDHGEMDSAHKMDHKSVLYREAVRIPFIMSFKGRIPAGAIDNTHLISNGLDLLPTLCDYAGIEAPRGLYGRSLRPLAAGKNVEDWRRFVVTESQDGRMLRTARFKYCIYDCGRHREQLIDRLYDSGEMKNLAEVAAYKDVLEEHRALLRKWVQETGDKIAARYIHV